MEQGRGTFSNDFGLVGFARTIVARLLSRRTPAAIRPNRRARQPIAAFPMLTTHPAAMRNVPLPMSDTEVARMAASAPQIYRHAERARHGVAHIQSRDEISNRVIAQENEQALAEALSRLRQLTKRGGH